MYNGVVGVGWFGYNIFAVAVCPSLYSFYMTNYSCKAFKLSSAVEFMCFYDMSMTDVRLVRKRTLPRIYFPRSASRSIIPFVRPASHQRYSVVQLVACTIFLLPGATNVTTCTHMTSKSPRQYTPGTKTKARSQIVVLEGPKKERCEDKTTRKKKNLPSMSVLGLLLRGCVPVLCGNLGR